MGADPGPLDLTGRPDTVVDVYRRVPSQRLVGAGPRRVRMATVAQKGVRGVVQTDGFRDVERRALSAAVVSINRGTAASQT